MGSNGEQSSVSEDFGLNEALFAYKMADSIGTGADQDLSLGERAEDAVRVALRMESREDIDIEIAKTALLGEVAPDIN